MAVLGASGHLGGHLVRLLLQRGQRVRALVRPTSDIRALEGLDVEIHRGDVTDPVSLATILRGCHSVAHLAAPTGRQADTVSVIVDGTSRVLEAFRDSDATRLVYVSSIVTVGYSNDPHVVLDEQNAQRSNASSYHSAKWEAERQVLTHSLRPAQTAVIVNPATLVGPLDYRVTPSNAPIQQCLDRGLQWALPGGLTIVHIEDAARGVMQALEQGRDRERYILGGERLRIVDYFSLIAELCDRPRPLATLPRTAVVAGAAALSGLEWLTGRPAPITYSQARQLVGRYGWYSSAKAERELGYAVRPAAVAVRDYVSWVRAGRPATST